MRRRFCRFVRHGYLRRHLRFHGLVGSGTSSKQIDKETDARCRILRSDGEGMLALAAIMATAAGFGS